MDDATRARRLGIAAALMNLSEDDTRKAVAAMDARERTKLAGHISWVQDYEETENPTWEE